MSLTVTQAASVHAESSTAGDSDERGSLPDTVRTSPKELLRLMENTDRRVAKRREGMETLLESSRPSADRAVYVIKRNLRAFETAVVKNRSDLKHATRLESAFMKLQVDDEVRVKFQAHLKDVEENLQRMITTTGHLIDRFRASQIVRPSDGRLFGDPPERSDSPGVSDAEVEEAEDEHNTTILLSPSGRTTIHDGTPRAGEQVNSTALESVPEITEENIMFMNAVAEAEVEDELNDMTMCADKTAYEEGTDKPDAPFRSFPTWQLENPALRRAVERVDSLMRAAEPAVLPHIRQA